MGTRAYLQRALYAKRFIPTYMGNAMVLPGVLTAYTVHPHVHGERTIGADDRYPVNGSSPRTWGTRLYVGRCPIVVRFIPTYMGNAFGALWIVYVGPVHPHVHGERLAILSMSLYIVGSSPRTWGTRIASVAFILFRRFIPTYMGNASPRRRIWVDVSVHPHVHGERRRRSRNRPRRYGSSPRTWGTLYECVD